MRGRAIERLVKSSRVILGLNVVGYLLGFVGVVLLNSQPGSFQLLELGLQFIYYIAMASLVGFVQVASSTNASPGLGRSSASMTWRLSAVGAICR